LPEDPKLRRADQGLDELGRGRWGEDRNDHLHVADDLALRNGRGGWSGWGGFSRLGGVGRIGVAGIGGRGGVLGGRLLGESRRHRSGRRERERRQPTPFPDMRTVRHARKRQRTAVSSSGTVAFLTQDLA
jgi:hypothetical protein